MADNDAFTTLPRHLQGKRPTPEEHEVGEKHKQNNPEEVGQFNEITIQQHVTNDNSLSNTRN